MTTSHQYGTRSRVREQNMADQDQSNTVMEIQDNSNRDSTSGEAISSPVPTPPTRRFKDAFQQGLSQAKALGLQGAELQEYVEKFQRRAEETQLAKEEADRQAQLAREEADRKTRAADRQAQLDKEEADRQERERQAAREHEYRMAQLAQQQTQAIGMDVNNSATNAQQKPNIKLRIPFLEDKDNVETWFIQFDRTAEDHGLTDTQKARQVFYYLKGKARDLYSRMSVEEQENYETVKATILKGFNLTGEDYRARFRNARRKENESLRELAVRLIDYFEKWINLEDAEEDIDQLKFILIKEQLIQIYPAELVRYIIDGSVSSKQDLLDRVDKYESRQKVLRTNHKEDRDMEKQRSKNGNRNRGNDTAADKDKDETQSKRKIPEKELERRRKNNLCLNCGKADHFARQCPDKKGKSGTASCVSCQSEDNPHVVVSTKDTSSKSQEDSMIKTELSQLCTECQGKPFQNFVRVKINGVETTAMRDTGCTGVVVAPEFVCSSQYTKKVVNTTLASTEVTKSLKVAVVNIDSPYFHEDTEVSVMEKPVHPVLIGQTYGLGRQRKTTPLFPIREPDWYHPPKIAVTTRLQERKEKTHTSDAKYMTESLKPAELRKAQLEDSSLKKIHQFAKSGQERKGVAYIYKKDVLLRVVTDRTGTKHSKVVVPATMREQVLKLGHDNALAGHLGTQKTTDRILLEFWWPGVVADIKRYVASCDACQRTCPRGKTPRAPLGKMPAVDIMFRRVAVDIIGPINPMSENKNRYILVMIDYNTRYPEAVALRDIKAETVMDALWEMWSRLGIPDVIITDQGSQFSGHLMAEVKELWKVKHNMTTAFHPQANGLVEKFNGTLKSMIRKLALEQPTKWDTFLPALLFAYREVPQHSTGFAPFEMLYGRKVKGPMQILREIWTQEEMSHETKTSAEYVVDLRNKIEETCKIAKEELSKAHRVQAKHFDRRSKHRTLKPGQQVLLLLPAKHNKLELTWKGPYKVIEKLGDVDYRIQMGSKSKVFHVNLMKEYLQRETVSPILAEIECYEDADKIIDGRNEYSAVVVAEEPMSEITELEERRDIILPAVKRTEDDKNVNVATQLTKQQSKEIHNLCEEYKDCLTDVPKTTHLEECRIELKEEKPVFVRPRPIPHTLVESVEKEIDEMLKLGVIEPANSPYNSPIVMIKKRNGEHRFCADLRALNNVTVDDREPISDVEHIFQSLGKAKFFSKLDLTKGYWAIPIVKDDRKKTAFTTTNGQFQWVNMPFGLKTAPGVFNRMMRKLLGPIKRPGLYHFMDDVLVATETWEEHLEILRAVFQRLKEANLAAKPSKCYLGFTDLVYLGHEIGHGQKWPEERNVEKIQTAKLPRTKKELRAFLGLCGFYRVYIQDYARIAAALTDLTKKQHPDKLCWSEEAANSFETLKSKICQKPVLQIPDYNKRFVLRTDASKEALGAVLLQEDNGILKPVAFQSKRLNSAESNYSTVERECYAAVWGVGKFERYLYGRKFILETDHQPLKSLQMNPTNPRLLRWSLQLQPFQYSVQYIPGKENHGADYLSRATYSKE